MKTVWRMCIVTLLVAAIGAGPISTAVLAATPIQQATVATALSYPPGCTIAVFMRTTADQLEVSRVGSLLARSGEFKLIIFIPKEIGFRAMERAHPDSVEQTLPYNPLPDSYKAVLISPLRLSTAAEAIRRWQGVALVKNANCPPLAA